LLVLAYVQSGLAKKVEKASRKLRKERKNRSKKVRGTSKAKAGDVSSPLLSSLYHHHHYSSPHRSLSLARN